jgi:Ca2+:H+ antiporter
VGRHLLWASLVLAPLAIVLRFAADTGDVARFLVSAAALVPLAWLIGEATEHAAVHTGPGIGGFLNASFGNAPELIIALFAIDDGLPNVVRGSIAGSIVSNLLLVLGLALSLGGDRPLDRRSLLGQLGIVLVACLVFLVPSVPGWHGNPDRHSLAVATIPVALVLLAVYLAATGRNLRRHRRQHVAAEVEVGASWGMPASLAALGAATALTAVVSEILVHSLEAFAHAAHLSQFFIAAVIVAIVGNAAEHGGAVVVAARGKLRLASEIAVSSSAQVALFVAPVVALVSWAIRPALPLAFRPIELGTMAGAATLVALSVRNARGTRAGGIVMLVAYAAVVVAYGFSGDR